MATTSPSPQVSPIDGDLSSAPFLHRVPSQSEETDNDTDGGPMHCDHERQEAVAFTSPKRTLVLQVGSYARVPSLDPYVSSKVPDSITKEDGTAPQRWEDSPSKPRGARAALEVWAFEVMALLASVIAFTTIFIILSAYDKQPQCDLSRGININTIIAILSTIVKATLVFVVAEVVGQSKWVWVESPQRLRDVEYFHEAGRGAWGSLKFLFKLWKPMTTALGAVVIVASFAIAPFSQQAATTYPCEIDVEGSASIDVAQWIGTGADGKMPVISSKTHVAAITGLIYGPSISAAGPTGFQCESGNCTFDAIGEVTHSSVGICSRCDKLVVHNETSENRTTFSIGRTDDNTKSTRPNITWPMSEGSDVFVMDSNQPPDSKKSERDFETSFLSLKIVECTEGMSSYEKGSRHCGQSPGLTSNQNGQGFEIIGAKCRLYPCFRNYHGSILNGRLNEQEISSVKMNISGVQLQGEGAANITIYQHTIEPCIVNDNSYDATNISAANMDNDWVVLNGTEGPVKVPRGCLRAMHFKAFSSISRGLSSTLHGTCFLKEVTRLKDDQPGGGGYDINCGEKWFLGPLFSQGNLTYESILDAYSGMAQAITSHLRATTLDPEGVHIPVNGTGKRTTICIRAEWSWLAYPGILLIVSACLLLATFVESCRDRSQRPIWKSSILPLLFYDVNVSHAVTGSEDGTHHRSAMPLLQLSDLKLLANTTVARFSVDRDTPRFVVVKEKEIADME